MLKIYIATHTDFEPIVHNPVYEILDSRKMDDDKFGNLSGFYFAELFNYHWYRHNTPYDEIPDYIGFCGYRKYFEFLDDVDEDEIIRTINENGCITGKQMQLPETVRQNYAINHNIYDMEKLTSFLEGEFREFFLKYLDGHDFYPCNMFIMKKDDFISLIDFVWNIIIKFSSDFKSDADVQKHVYDEFMKGHTICMGGIKHQSRIGGYIGERVVSGYLKWKFPNAVSAGMKITGNRIRK